MIFYPFCSEDCILMLELDFFQYPETEPFTKVLQLLRASSGGQVSVCVLEILAPKCLSTIWQLHTVKTLLVGFNYSFQI